MTKPIGNPGPVIIILALDQGVETQGDYAKNEAGHDKFGANNEPVELTWDQTGPIQSKYTEAVNQAAIVLLAMSFSPTLRCRLFNEITAAVKWRGGQIDGHWLVKYELRAVCEEVVESALAMLSVILRDRLPGVADEMDGAFGDRLRDLLCSFLPLFPTL